MALGADGDGSRLVAVALRLQVTLVGIVGEDDAAGVGACTAGDSGEVGTESLDRCHSLARSRHLVVAVACGVQRVGVRTYSEGLLAVGGHEGISALRVGNCCRLDLVVADIDADARVRCEGDDLLGELGDATVYIVIGSGVLRLEVTAEVELVVGLARQTEDIGRGTCQQRIVLVGMR